MEKVFLTPEKLADFSLMNFPNQTMPTFLTAKSDIGGFKAKSLLFSIPQFERMESREHFRVHLKAHKGHSSMNRSVPDLE